MIATNCEQYNGAESELTKDARVLVDFTKMALDEVCLQNELPEERMSETDGGIKCLICKFLLNFQCSVSDHCASLEKNIALVQERAKNEADMDDIWADVEETDDRNVSELFKF